MTGLPDLSSTADDGQLRALARDRDDARVARARDQRVAVPGELSRRRIDLTLRALDVAIASSTLLVLSPLIIGIAGAQLASSGRPVFYRGLRVGRDGRTFTMIKFRTLRPGAESRLALYPGPELSRLSELEASRFGRILRISQLDELPQLWNVLRGDMSIVGPRPIRPVFFDELTRDIPQYWQRLVVRPGLGGLAQLRMTRDMSWEEKLAHDLEWIADRSVSLYLRVASATVARILGSSVSVIMRRDRATRGR